MGTDATWGSSTLDILWSRCSSNDDIPIQHCHDIAASLVDIITHHSDVNIQASDFAPLLQRTDFSFPSDATTSRMSRDLDPMIWLRCVGASTPVWPLPPHFLTPETTAGGSLMEGVVFCGAPSHPQDNDCSIETSRAYWKFWEAVYYKFAQSLRVARERDHLTIVVEPYADVQFLERSIVPFLIGNSIPSDFSSNGGIMSVTIYETEGNCDAPNVKRLMNVLRAQKMKEVVCRRSIWELWNPKQTEAEEELRSTETEAPTGTKGGTTTPWVVLLLLDMIAVVVSGLCLCASLWIIQSRKPTWTVEFSVGEELPLFSSGKAIQEDDMTDSYTGGDLSTPVET